MTIDEGYLQFEFPMGWQVTQFDEWHFYRNQFQKVVAGLKAVDIVALSPDKVVWFIEIKDYRQHPRKKVIDLADEVAIKIKDTLAALLPAKINANDDNEKQLANIILQAWKIRIILHLEQPKKHSKLFPRAIDLAKIQQKLRQQLKAIDPHPLVWDRENIPKGTWQVTSKSHS